MLMRLRSAGLLWPTAIAVPALVVLLGLGTWQLQRKAWKDALMLEMAARASQPPVALAMVERRQRAGEPIEYARVATRGRFLHAHEMHLYSPYPPVKGWLVLTPLLTDGGKVVWINRGGVPEQLKDPAQRAAGQIAGEASIVGVVRWPEPVAAFTPKDDPGKNIWYRRDPLQRSPVLAGEPGVNLAQSPGFYLEAEAEPANPGGWPRGAAGKLRISNRHLEYAITWFGLAATLIGVFAAYVRACLARGAGD